MPDDMQEEEKTILTQRIRNPKLNSGNPWIEIFNVKENENKEQIIYTNSIITHDNMYKGKEPNKKPVAEDVIQNNAITNAAMFKITDDKIKDLETEEDKQLARNKRPVSSDTIQDNAIVDNKIANKTITMRKISEPFFKMTSGTKYNNSEYYNYTLKLYCQDENTRVNFILNPSSAWAAIE